MLLLVPVGLFGGIWGPAIMFSAIAAISVFEMLSCCGLLKKWYISAPAIICTAFCVILPAIFSARIMLTVAAFIALIPVFLSGFLAIGVIKHKEITIERLLMFFSLAMYITAGFTSLSVLAVLKPFGFWTLVFVFAVAWITDTMAYFSGMLFGKRKLCPEISPKKTIAGAIGGTLFGTVAGVIVFWAFCGSPAWGLIAFPISIIGQFGDLAASVVKRHLGIKDYGKIFPGHGGVLDRFDSVIPVSIFTTIVLISTLVIANYIKYGIFGF